ncbi:MAG: hypothetical protein ACJAT2_003233 [Bacteriovoracaceae bacterium]|jgi:hypothetical protein
MPKYLENRKCETSSILSLEAEGGSVNLPSMSLIKFLPFLVILLFLFEKAYALDTNFNNFVVIDEDGFSGGLNGDLTKEHPLYKKIMDEFGSTYEDIGKRQAERALAGKDVFVGGGLNKIGIRYGKDFVDFSVNVERQLAPDLFDDERWIVRDMFTFEISAAALLSKLSDEGTIDIGESQAALFAGLSFKRKFTWVHFADSYNDGLTRRFDKLFLPFLSISPKKLLSIPDGEILKKEDSLTFSAGAIGSLPVSGPIWASAGALAKYKKLASIQLQGVSQNEQIKSDEKLRIQVEKNTGVEVGIRASLQVDFLKLLRFTLLSFDFSYELDHSYTTHLSFSTRELEEVYYDEELQRQLKNAFRYGYFDGRRYPHLVLATEESKKATMNSKYLLLLLGGIKDQSTTHVEINKEDRIHTFFKHYFEKTTFVQNFLSRFMSGVIKSLLGLGSSINNALSDVRRFELEYKSTENLLESKDKYKVSKENFSMTIDRSFNSGRLNKLTKRAAIEILESYGGVDPLVWVLLRNDQLHGPLHLNGKFIIKKEGLGYLNTLSYKEVYAGIKSICKNFFCRKSIEKKFDSYWKELNHKSYDHMTYMSCKPKYKLFQSARKRRYLWESCLQKRTKVTLEEKMTHIPLWRLKGFMNKLTEKSSSKVDLYNFFGVSNVFLHGSFEALDQNQREFVSYFREGQFNGLGVIDSFLIGNGLKAD